MFSFCLCNKVFRLLDLQQYQISLKFQLYFYKNEQLLL